MLAFAVVAMTVAAASEVSLTVEPSTACVERGRIVSALQGKGLRVRETPGAETLLVRVISSGGAVEVRGTQRERKLERRVPVEGAACPAVERVVVALIESWANMTRPPAERDAGTRGDALGAENVRVDARTLLAVGAEQRADGGVSAPTQIVFAKKEDAGVVAMAVPRAGDGSAVLAATSVQSVDTGSPSVAKKANTGVQASIAATALSPALSPAGEREDAGTTSTATTGLSRVAQREDAGTQASTAATALSPTLSPEGEREDAGTTSPAATGLSPEGEKEDAGTTRAAARQNGPLRLDVAVLGGATIDTSGLPAGTGSLFVRGAIGRWGLLIDAALESARSNTIAPVTASATQQTLSVSLSVAFEPSASLTLDVALGLRGWRVEGTATGADLTFVDSTLRWGGVFSAGLAWRLTGPLFLTARGSASVRDNVIHLEVEPLGTVLSLNPWFFGLQGGVLVRFD